MTELFRGILDILNANIIRLGASIKSHIRKTNPTPNKDEDEDWASYKIAGFWNLMLELVFNVYIIFMLFTGVILTWVMALIGYPFRLIYGIFANMFTATVRYRYMDVEEYEQALQQQQQEEPKKPRRK